MIQSIHLGKCQAALMFLIRSANSEEMSKDAWIENVTLVVEAFPTELKTFALQKLSQRRQHIWLMITLMSMWDIPTFNGRTAVELAATAFDQDQQPNYFGDYHPLRVPMDAVEVVDAVQRLHSILDEIEADAPSVIGIDCEWNSSKTGFEVSELALLQVATRSRCYLIDVFTLKKGKYFDRICVIS